MLSKIQKEPNPEIKKSDTGLPLDTRQADPKAGWRKRLLSLDADRQKQIALKYYGGHMPWKD